MSDRKPEGLFRIKDLLSEAASFLEENNVEAPRLEAQVLLAFVLEINRTKLAVDLYEPVPGHQKEKFRELVRKRSRGCPLQYLTGEKEFMGRTFLVSPEVLIPRDDTAVLVETAAAILGSGNGWDKVADIGTGSGVVAIMLKNLLPHITVYASDIATGALELARENARRQGTGITFMQSDLLETYREKNIRLQAVIANPPYIRRGDLPGLALHVRQEPAAALDGGPDGLVYYRRLAREAPGVLERGGLLAVETGCDQGKQVEEIFRHNGYNNVRVTRDLEGRDRVVTGFLQGV